MQKTDFKKQDKALYSGKPGVIGLIDVPEMTFLVLTGKGDPNHSPSYARAVGALYALSYGLKFHGKANHALDHVVPPLEALWWADDMGAFKRGDKENWQWQVMIRQPDWVDIAALETVRANALVKTAKKKDAPTDADTLNAVALQRFAEGQCVQVLHLGSYADEAPLLARLHDEYLPENGLVPAGRHHEIYLSDPRKVAPEKLKTILRQPVRAG